jgi:DNA replication and repair protein RecF
VPVLTTPAVITADSTPIAPSPARLRRLTARDFRNLAGVSLEVPEAGLALVGDNGHGKTNLLEAVYYLHIFRSARPRRGAGAIRRAGFHVAAVAEGTLGTGGAGFEREREVAADRSRRRSPERADALGAPPQWRSPRT